MAQGAWRPGMATRCGRCASEALSYTEDGSAQCAACGFVTAPAWAAPAKPSPPEPPAPAAESRPPLRFVTPPEGTAALPQPSAGPQVLLGPASRRRSFSAEEIRRNRIVAGAILMAFGAVVTAGTYSLAASSPGGGTYFIAFGPILFGGYLVARGIATPVTRRR